MSAQETINTHVEALTGALREICPNQTGDLLAKQVAAMARIAVLSAPDPCAESLAGRVKQLEAALVNIREYWNRDQNEQAMADACWHAIETADTALSSTEGE